MTTVTVKEVLRDCLDELTGAEFKRFKSTLRDQGGIAWGKLEKADTDDTVHLMVVAHNTGVGGVVLTILKKMNHNQLATDLEKRLGELGGQECSPGQTPGGGGAGGGGGVKVAAFAHSGGKVNAPVMSGCTISGPLTFNS